MLLGLTYQLIRFIADLVLIRTRSDPLLRAEVLTLRHQLRMLERRVGKPAWQPVTGSCSATQGWDPVTGLGTPNAAKLLPDLIAQVNGI